MGIDIDIQKLLPGFTLRVSLTSKAGILVLFGPSGAGKSLTLQCVAGIVRPDSGRIIVTGNTLYDSARGIDLPPQRRRIGYVPQDYALFPHMTVADNIAFGLRTHGSSSRQREVASLIEMLRLTGLEKRRPRDLSGGQSQRVALARALAVKPDLLLLDEPFSALDAPLRDALRSDLGQVHRELQTGIIFVTHGVAETHVLAQEVAILNEGRVLQMGPTAKLFREPATLEVARLTGVRNVLAGEVVESDRGECWVQIGPARLRSAIKDLAVGTRVLAIIRSEYARFLREGEQADVHEEWITGFVTAISNQGHLYSVDVALGSQDNPMLRVLAPVWWWERWGPSQGERCRLAVPSCAVHLIPESPKRYPEASGLQCPPQMQESRSAEPVALGKS